MDEYEKYNGGGKPDMEQSPSGIRAFHVGAGFNVNEMSRELSEYVDILLGRIEPPIDAGVLTLMECAEAFHARAKEMEMEILDAERTGAIGSDNGPAWWCTMRQAPPSLANTLVAAKCIG